MENERPRLSNTKFNSTLRKRKTKKSAEVWKSCDLLPVAYTVSSYGRIKIKTTFGSKIVEPFERGAHLFFTATNNRLVKEDFMVAEIVLYVFRCDFHFGARIKFKDGNPRNVDVDNMRFKTKTQPVVESSKVINEWKCGTKASAANERYKDRTRERITGDEVLLCLKMQHFMCFYCGDLLDKDTWQLDHREPVSKGGHNNIKNLAPACRHCNFIKADTGGVEFLQHVEKLYIALTGDTKAVSFEEDEAA